MVKLHSNGSFSLDNLQNKSLICLDSHMTYVTFEHLSMTTSRTKTHRSW